MGNRPARLTGAEAQFALGGQAVDLEHHAVDFVGQAVASLADVAVVGQAFFDAGGMLEFAADRQPPGLELLEDTDVAVANARGHLADAIAAEFQRAAGGDFRIQLTQAAGGGVARVGEGLATGFGLGGVEPIETGLAHVHLAAHLQHRRPSLALQLERDVAHGTHVGTDVFASGAVATGGALHQLAVAVQQAYGQAVELGLAAVVDRTGLVEAVYHATAELTQVGFFEGVAQAEHGHFVAYLAERGQGFAPNALGGRVGGYQVRVFGFKRLELVEQAVVFGIGHAWLIEHVVAVVVLVELGTQFVDTGFGGHGICLLLQSKRAA